MGKYFCLFFFSKAKLLVSFQISLLSSKWGSILLRLRFSFLYFIRILETPLLNKLLVLLIISLFCFPNIIFNIVYSAVSFIITSKINLLCNHHFFFVIVNLSSDTQYFHLFYYYSKMQLDYTISSCIGNQFTDDIY